MGLEVLAVNLVASVRGILVSQAFGYEYAGALIPAVAVLTPCSPLPAILYLFADLAIGGWLPAMRRSGGAVIFLLACLPWLSSSAS